MEGEDSRKKKTMKEMKRSSKFLPPNKDPKVERYDYKLEGAAQPSLFETKSTWKQLVDKEALRFEQQKQKHYGHIVASNGIKRQPQIN